MDRSIDFSQVSVPAHDYQEHHRRDAEKGNLYTVRETAPTISEGG